VILFSQLPCLLSIEMSGFLLEGQSVHHFDSSTLSSTRAARPSSAATGRFSRLTAQLSLSPVWAWALCVAVAYDLEPAWSPDGTKIVFASNRTGNWDIWIADDLPSNVEATTWGQIKTRFWH